jgi:2-polyprenyl-3-methyl-5-hydroxy-6-metoxy-1,4-benzoquinol methylase
MTAAFSPISRCWVCDADAASLSRVHHARFHFPEYADQDPELAAYTGSTVDIHRCRRCGFAQPAAMPMLPRYFDRMYDQHWSEEWVAAEHEAEYKDFIFREILRFLERRVTARPRRLLDIGAHAGRFLRMAQAAGWQAEGLELNPRTAAFARQATGVPVHLVNVHDFDASDRRFHAITLTDVLEHVPDPLAILRRVHQLLDDEGWVSVKVPNAPSQRLKESVRGHLQRHYRPRIADNLVHINHFSARSLELALSRAGFSRVALSVGAPELPPPSGTVSRGSRAARLLAFHTASALPFGVRSPLAFNLQAYAKR